MIEKKHTRPDDTLMPQGVWGKVVYCSFALLSLTQCHYIKDTEISPLESKPYEMRSREFLQALRCRDYARANAMLNSSIARRSYVQQFIKDNSDYLRGKNIASFESSSRLLKEYNIFHTTGHNTYKVWLHYPQEKQKYQFLLEPSSGAGAPIKIIQFTQIYAEAPSTWDN